MSPSATEPQAIADTQTAIFADRLSVDGVEARRSRAPKLNGGIAAYTSSEMFKSPVRMEYAYPMAWCGAILPLMHRH